MSTIPIGSTDKARTAQAVIIVDRATGEPAAAGGGAGTSDTTEATQLLVKTAVETSATNSASALTKLDTLHTDLTTPATVLPPRPLRTDVANFPTKTLIEATGADTDALLAAAGAGKRTFITGGYLQTDIDVVLTLKSATTDISETIILKANDILRFECPNDIPEFWSGVNEEINVAKSTAATLRGHLFSVAA